MNNFIVAVGAVAPLAIYLLMGIFMRWYAHFDDHSIFNFNKLIFTIFLPTNMFASIYYADMSSTQHLPLVGYALSSLVIFYMFMFILIPRIVKDNKKWGTMIQAIYRSNFLLMGVPIVENIYGPESTAGAMVLLAFCVPVYNILAVFCLETFRGGSFNLTEILKGVMKNPMIIAAVAAAILRNFDFSFPFFLEKSMKAISIATTPLALIVLGASFTIQSAISDIKNLMLCVLGRLVFMPLFVVTGAVLLGLRNVELASLMSMSISPTAIASYSMAQQMNGDGELAGNAVIFSTGLSIFTMFLWIYCFKVFGLL